MTLRYFISLSTWETLAAGARNWNWTHQAGVLLLSCRRFVGVHLCSWWILWPQPGYAVATWCVALAIPRGLQLRSIAYASQKRESSRFNPQWSPDRPALTRVCGLMRPWRSGSSRRRRYGPKGRVCSSVLPPFRSLARTQRPQLSISDDLAPNPSLPAYKASFEMNFSLLWRTFPPHFESVL